MRRIQFASKSVAGLHRCYRRPSGRERGNALLGVCGPFTDAGGGRLLPFRAGDFLSRHHDRDDAGDLRPDEQRQPTPDGGLSLARRWTGC